MVNWQSLYIMMCQNIWLYSLPCQMHMMREIVVQIRKCDFVLCANWLANNDFVNIIELIPILIPKKKKKRLLVKSKG